MTDQKTGMSLSRIIPSRRETFNVMWLKRDFMAYNETWRRARLRMKKPIDVCWWCKRPFAEGDMIALAGIRGKVNKTLCQSCADEAEGETP